MQPLLQAVIQPLRWQGQLLHWGPFYTCQQQLQHWQCQIRRPAVILGWSLGGQLATLLALRCQALALITLASNGCFVEGAYPGMPAQQFQQFRQQYQHQPQIAQRRFVQLQCLGGSKDTRLRQQLSHYQLSDRPQMLALAQLDWLQHCDVWPVWRALPYGLRHLALFAQHDALVPTAVADALPGAVIIPGQHACVLQHPNSIAQPVVSWCRQALE